MIHNKNAKDLAKKTLHQFKNWSIFYPLLMQFLNYMITLRTKLKQFYLGLLLLSALIPGAVFGLSAPSFAECNGNAQCERFRSWGFSMDIAKHADHIKRIMGLTRIDTNKHNSTSFLHAIDSNWSPHSSGTAFSEYESEIFSATTRLKMNLAHNDIPLYSPNGLKLQVFILGSHPKQLCSLLAELVLFQSRINQTVMFGSATPAYEENDYLYCSALNASQRRSLQRIASNRKLISDKEIMSVYFSDPKLNASFPVISDNQPVKHDAIFSNNYQMLSYLKANPQMARLHLSVIVASPQPYMPEALSILRQRLKEPSIYRFSKVGKFNTYESLNALRSWLKTDHSLNQ